MLAESDLGTIGLVGTAIIGVAVWAYVSICSANARKRGEDGRAARRSALADALPVAGAGLIGLYVFLTAILVIFMVFFFSLLDGSAFSHPDAVQSHVEWIFFGATAILVGLPVLAFAIVVVVKRHRP